MSCRTLLIITVATMMSTEDLQTGGRTLPLRLSRKRAKCFVDEYSNFTVEGSTGIEHVNGALTLGENIADAGGLHAAS